MEHSSRQMIDLVLSDMDNRLQALESRGAEERALRLEARARNTCEEKNNDEMPEFTECRRRRKKGGKSRSRSRRRRR